MWYAFVYFSFFSCYELFSITDGCRLVVTNLFEFNAPMQKHDIFKQRIDAHGNVIATKQDAVGGMKVRSSLVVLKATHIACRMYNNTPSKFSSLKQSKYEVL